MTIKGNVFVDSAVFLKVVCHIQIKRWNMLTNKLICEFYLSSY